MAFTLPNKPFLSLFVFSFLFALKYWGEVRAIEDSNNPHDKRLVLPNNKPDPCDFCRSACSRGSATGSCKLCC